MTVTAGSVVSISVKKVSMTYIGTISDKRPIKPDYHAEAESRDFSSIKYTGNLNFLFLTRHWLKVHTRKVFFYLCFALFELKVSDSVL